MKHGKGLIRSLDRRRALQPEAGVALKTPEASSQRTRPTTAARRRRRRKIPRMRRSRAFRIGWHCDAVTLRSGRQFDRTGFAMLCLACRAIAPEELKGALRCPSAQLT